MSNLKEAGSDYVMDVKTAVAGPTSGKTQNVIEPYVRNRLSWTSWKAECELVMKLYKVPEDEKVRFLLRSLGRTTLMEVVAWMRPKEVVDASYVEIMAQLDQNLDSREDVVDRRLRLLKFEKAANVSWMEYTCAHRELLAMCDFDAKSKDEMGFLALLHTMTNGDLKRKLRDQMPKTMNEVYEVIIRWSRLNECQFLPVEQVHAVSKGSKIKCFCCGQEGHKKPSCPRREERCQKCKRQGHVTKLCRKEEVNQVQELYDHIY